MNPIETAVNPLRIEAVDRARSSAEQMIRQMTEVLEAVGYDLNKAAPYPKTTIGRAAYMVAMSRRSMFKHVFVPAKPTRKFDEPDLVVFSDAAGDRFIESAGQDAAVQYDAFVAKLNAKIGEVVDAELVGNHVWGYSKLYVTKEDGTKECWKTQMIINVSKLGKVFNQFPTRKVKA